MSMIFFKHWNCPSTPIVKCHFLKLPPLSGFEYEEYYDEDDSIVDPDPLYDEDQPDDKRIKLEYDEEDQFDEDDFEVEQDHKPQFVYLRDDSMQ